MKTFGSPLAGCPLREAVILSEFGVSAAAGVEFTDEMPDKAAMAAVRLRIVGNFFVTRCLSMFDIVLKIIPPTLAFVHRHAGTSSGAL
jgi:hypothetical protein